VYDDIAILGLFATMRRGLDNLDQLYDTAIRRSFAQSALMDTLFKLFIHGSAACQCAAYELCSVVFPVLNMELVDQYANKSGLLKLHKVASFLEFLLVSVGHAVNVWSRRDDLTSDNEAHDSRLRENSEAEYSVAMSKVTLLRAFATTLDGSEWNAALTNAISDVVDHTLPETLAHVTKEIERENKITFTEKSSDMLHLTHKSDNKDSQFTRHNVDILYGALMLLGGDYPVLYSGAVAVYCNEATNGLKEDCLVLGPAAVPVYDLKTHKDTAKLWEGYRCFGDAVAVMLLSQPGEYLVVPRKYISASDPISNIANTTSTNSTRVSKFTEYLKTSVGTDKLLKLFAQLTNVDTTDKRDILLSNVASVTETQHFESTHPYPDNENATKAVTFPGAASITIEFDASSATEHNCDYLLFFSDSAKTKQIGQKFSGRNGDQNFPGCEGRDALVIPGDNFVFTFHSDGSTNVSVITCFVFDSVVDFRSHLSFIVRTGATSSKPLPSVCGR
jgi:hypothetical protein